MTHNFNFYIILNFNNQIPNIKSIDSIVLGIQSADIINFYVFL